MYFPATHNAHAPGSPVLPAAQSNLHAANAVLPAGDTPPAPHAVQAVAPTLGMYVSTGQLVHAVAATVNLYEPAGQSKHSADPLAGLYLPDTHAEQTADKPSAPVYPASQVQTLTDRLEPAAHTMAVHAAKDVLPDGDVVPAGQS